MAFPGNINNMVDIITNLIFGSCNLPIVQNAGLDDFLVTPINAIVALVKYLVHQIFDEKMIPGLAALVPDGEFIRDLNEIQDSQPKPEDIEYYAITADFDLDRQDSSQTGLSDNLIFWLRDIGMDRLMENEPNDLMLNVPSMTYIDPAGGNYIDDKLDFGITPVVYHSNYFLQDQTATKIKEWLI